MFVKRFHVFNRIIIQGFLFSLRPVIRNRFLCRIYTSFGR